jgi:hypothetical protein
MMTRVTIHAATAVAARIVKNQNKRFPRRRNGLDRGRTAAEAVLAERARREFPGPVLPRGRRKGEIHGRMVWTGRLLTTPVRPYSTSTTTATNASSFNPIMIASFLEVDRSPAALVLFESRSEGDNSPRGRPCAAATHGWYCTSRGRVVNERQHGRNTPDGRGGRQIGSNRGQSVSTGTTRGRLLDFYRTATDLAVKCFPVTILTVPSLSQRADAPGGACRKPLWQNGMKLDNGLGETRTPTSFGHRLLRPTRLPFRHEAPSERTPLSIGVVSS